MTGEIRLDAASARRIEADMASIADALHTERSRVDQLMSSLVGGSWTGVAADTFGSGWREWYDGAGDVIGALHAMSRLIGEARVGLATQDGTVAAVHQLLQSRLGPL